MHSTETELATPGRVGIAICKNLVIREYNGGQINIKYYVITKSTLKASSDNKKKQ